MEWERLAKEAGNIDIALFQKVLEADADELFDVIIYPLYVETAEIKAALERLAEEYPELAYVGTPQPFSKVSWLDCPHGVERGTKTPPLNKVRGQA